MSEQALSYSNRLIDGLLISLIRAPPSAPRSSPLLLSSCCGAKEPSSCVARRGAAPLDLNSALVKFTQRSTRAAGRAACCRRHKNILQIWLAEFEAAKNRKWFGTAAFRSWLPVSDVGSQDVATTNRLAVKDATRCRLQLSFTSCPHSTHSRLGRTYCRCGRTQQSTNFMWSARTARASQPRAKFTYRRSLL